MATCRSLGDGRAGKWAARISCTSLCPASSKWKAITVSEQMSRLGHIGVAVPIERMPGDKAAGGSIGTASK